MHPGFHPLLGCPTSSDVGRMQAGFGPWTSLSPKKVACGANRAYIFLSSEWQPGVMGAELSAVLPNCTQTPEQPTAV